jgi:hypothetical protein
MSMSASCTAPRQTHSQDQDQDQDEQEPDTENGAGAGTHRAQVVKSASSISLAGDRLAVENDVWTLLGCASPPDVMELEAIWNLTATTAASTVCSPRYCKSTTNINSNSNKTKRPSRASLKDRMHRIQRLRQHRWAGATRHGVTLSQHGPYSPSISLRAVSMDYLDTKDYSNWKDSSIDLSAASLANAMGLNTTTRTYSSLTPGDPSQAAHHRTGVGMGPSHSQHSYREQHRGAVADSSCMKADGYDSDPEFGGSNSNSAVHGHGDDLNNNSNHQYSDENRVLADQHQHPLPKVEAEMGQLAPQSAYQDFIIYQTVQVSTAQFSTTGAIDPLFRSFSALCSFSHSKLYLFTPPPSAANTQFHVDVDLASKRSERQRVSHCPQTTHDQYLDGTGHCHHTQRRGH